MSKGKSEKYQLMESLANSLKDERNQMFKEIVRLRDEVKDLKENKQIYIVKDAHGDTVACYRDYKKAVEHIEKNEKKVKDHFERGIIRATSESYLIVYMFHLVVREFKD